jgi:hypothetical protein
MDPAARYQDEALVVLTVADEAGHGQHVPETGPVERRVLLSSSNPSIKIGRTSKRKAELEPVKGNCYFDCPVMSRDHAMLHLDAELQVRQAKKPSNRMKLTQPTESSHQRYRVSTWHFRERTARGIR